MAVTLKKPILFYLLFLENNKNQGIPFKPRKLPCLQGNPKKKYSFLQNFPAGRVKYIKKKTKKQFFSIYSVFRDNY